MLGSRLAFASAAVKWSHLPVSTPPPSTRRLLTMRAGPDVLCLDCTGTIMRIKGSMPRLYLGVLEDRLGVSEGGLPDKVSEQDLLDSFRASLKRRSKELPCFGTGVMSSEDWWAEVVMATFRGAGVSDETLGISQEGGRGGGGGGGGARGGRVFDDVFDRLFHDVFTSTTAWELVPGAEEVLEDLRAWVGEDGGPRALGAVSNFDERLHPLLKNLGVYDSFDFVLTSRECGSEKPEPHMFLEALKRAGSSGGGDGDGRGVIVGDTFRTDVLGARSVGWDAVLITRGKDPATEEEQDTKHYARVNDLRGVPAALGRGR
ncbi:haloacid dehalogenase-like hydrolase [Ectocarpus siliculosus]|uniref:Haloacid dehalogenase-like hydrolase n=1 Tax=Ectocarpus siliculosus TaxID=2880 RepID=D8LT61_ECTSI|nr:haloacid dehalogenase-like hydrolase [Ectocarpus siliculosus]|eukprot:CBN77932.1 haloacid dehalogenase-like hydrolase [Ectocarpus siliculosus]